MTAPERGVSESRASALRGQCVGAMVLAGAGLGWTLFGLSALGDVPLGLFLAALAIPALLAVAALSVRRSAPDVPDAPWTPGLARAFRWAVAGEIIGSLAALTVAGLLGRPEWDPALVALAVGLHFLPLARAFHRPLYYFTAAGLCSACLAAFLVLPPLGAHRLAVWKLVPGLGAGATLWLTTLVMLAQSRAGLRAYARAALTPPAD